MITRWANLFVNLRKRSLAARGLLLASVALGLLALVSPIAYYRGHQAGLVAAAVAAAVCLAGATGALAVSHLLSGPKHVWYGLLLGMMVRMGAPLGIGVACLLDGGALAENGMVVYLLVFYPVTLALETILSLPTVDSATHSADVPRNTTS